MLLEIKIIEGLYDKRFNLKLLYLLVEVTMTITVTKAWSKIPIATNLLVSLLFNNLLSLQIFFDLIQLITLFNTNMFLLRFKCFFCLKFFNTYE